MVNLEPTNNKKPFVFILGRERSGTTLLRNILNSNSNIYIPTEAPIIIHLYKKYHNKKNINIESFLKDLFTIEHLKIWDFDKSKLKKKLDNLKVKDFTSVCFEVYNLHFPHKKLIGDKLPLNSIFINWITEVFPEAKILWIMRDYRAQINSMLHVNFEKKIASSLAIRWIDYNRSIEKFKSNFPEKVKLIRYEDLVENPESTVKKICNFIDIKFENQMVTERNSNNENLDPKFHNKLEGEISNKYINDWKNDKISLKEIKISEAICGDFGEKYGFKKQYNSNHNPYKYIFGLFYGRLYIFFFKILFRLPFNIRVYILNKLIGEKSKFWKDSKKHYNIN